MIALVGDGGLLFTVGELATAAELGLPLPVVVANNGGYGEIRDQMDEAGIGPRRRRPARPGPARCWARRSGAPACATRTISPARCAMHWSAQAPPSSKFPASVDITGRHSPPVRLLLL